MPNLGAKGSKEQMAKETIFCVLTRGASLHKCRDSLASPVLQRLHRRHEQQQQQQHQQNVTGGKSRRTQTPETSANSCSAESVRAKHNISVKGLIAVPAPFGSFNDELPPEADAADSKSGAADGDNTPPEAPRKMPPWLLSRLEALGYKEPTPIQMQWTDSILLNSHYISLKLALRRGSGTATAATGAPSLSVGPNGERQNPRIFAARDNLSQEGTGFKAAFPQSHSGSRYGAADAVFATPLSLLTLLKEKRLSLSDCQHLVLDEADRLLDSGFSPQVDALLFEIKSATATAKRLHICLFSATLPPSVVLLAESITYGAVHVTVGRASAAAPQIEQELVFCSTEAGKLWALKNLRVERKLIPPCLIFVETQERASELLREMITEGMTVDLLHAAKSKQQRDATVDAFRTGKIWFLICTDLVARGIDFKGVALVINFDLPISTSVYIHRIGRTGRAGKEGKALTFFTLDDVPRLRPIVQIMQKSPNSKIPPFLNSRLTRNLRVKGQKKNRGRWTPHSNRPSGRSRKPIRPVARAVVMKAKRRAWAVAASLAKKKKAKELGDEASTTPHVSTANSDAISEPIARGKGPKTKEKATRSKDSPKGKFKRTHDPQMHPGNSSFKRRRRESAAHSFKE
ncbi:ATP-dependent RNA helicase, putative [Eimeria tenella]|uniref:RNA helicase n=1 Tax=Eimeria tenella TaxID=5802 RepID=U6KRP5_EIMTE|nr:ATP-dependent RNA helicase, putative [Eimeria tenella]CDJ38108.1 ATP-dependent RNA helicase, putative [Eimeria tenella]|eukprot:XP_013228946.1 ATP-dependent RNA helicase, putative [Eimeria tenella]